MRAPKSNMRFAHFLAPPHVFYSPAFSLSFCRSRTVSFGSFVRTFWFVWFVCVFGFFFSSRTHTHCTHAFTQLFKACLRRTHCSSSSGSARSCLSFALYSPPHAALHFCTVCFCVLSFSIFHALTAPSTLLSFSFLSLVFTACAHHTLLLRHAQHGLASVLRTPRTLVHAAHWDVFTTRLSLSTGFSLALLPAPAFPTLSALFLFAAIACAHARFLSFTFYFPRCCRRLPTSLFHRHCAPLRSVYILHFWLVLFFHFLSILSPYILLRAHSFRFISGSRAYSPGSFTLLAHCALSTLFPALFPKHGASSLCAAPKYLLARSCGSKSAPSRARGIALTAPRARAVCSSWFFIALLPPMFLRRAQKAHNVVATLKIKTKHRCATHRRIAQQRAAKNSAAQVLPLLSCAAALLYGIIKSSVAHDIARITRTRRAPWFI